MNWLTPDSVANSSTVDAQGEGRTLVVVGDTQPAIPGVRVTGRGPLVIHTFLADGIYTAVVSASNPESIRAATTTVIITRPKFFVYLPFAVRAGD